MDNGTSALDGILQFQCQGGLDTPQSAWANFIVRYIEASGAVMNFRIKSVPGGSEEMVEVCEDDVVIATIRAGDLPRSLLMVSKHFSHAVFDRHEQPEKLIAHFREKANGPR